MTEARPGGRAFFERQQRRRREAQARLTGRRSEPPAPAAAPSRTQRPEPDAVTAAVPRPKRSRSRPPAASGPALRVVVTSGPTAGQAFDLGAGELIIGREAGSDIHLDDLRVSHSHALLRVRGGVATIEDLRSTNGTSVNGEIIDRPVPIAPDDVIVVGPVQLRVERRPAGRDSR